MTPRKPRRQPPKAAKTPAKKSPVGKKRAPRPKGPGPAAPTPPGPPAGIAPATPPAPPPEPRTWTTVTPDGWTPPVGYANAVVSRGRDAGLDRGADRDGAGREGALPGRPREAGGAGVRQRAAVLTTAGGRPDHLVRVRLYVRNAEEYGSRAKEIGRRGARASAAGSPR